MALRKEGYWDGHYEQELKNYMEDGDEGEIWFGKRLNRNIVEWILEQLSSRAVVDETIWANNKVDVIDIGCGNSFLLCTMMEKFSERSEPSRISLNALGIDYSRNSISLSSKIVRDRQMDDLIQLQQCDITSETQVSSITEKRKFNFIIDKGTYDALCLLNAESEEKLGQTKEAYLRSIRQLGKPGKSIFILASCNHTEEELLALFDSMPSDEKPKLIDRIETPSIQFGGKSGSQVTCLIFEFIVI